jgi:hypothetical protein
MAGRRFLEALNPLGDSFFLLAEERVTLALPRTGAAADDVVAEGSHVHSEYDVDQLAHGIRVSNNPNVRQLHSRLLSDGALLRESCQRRKSQHRRAAPREPAMRAS